MQIHELNNKKPANISEQQINEIDLFGPQGIAAIGKQVWNNKKALYNPAELGAAKQAAAQDYAAGSAEKLANPSAFRKALGNRTYNVGSTKTPVTTAQQLQAVKANPAVQSQVTSLASQWASQSAALKKAQLSTTPAPVTEAAITGIQFDPRELANDPKFQPVYQDLKKQTGFDPKAEIDLEKKLTNWEQNFKSWMDPKLAAGGIGVDDVERDPATAALLKKALTKIAVAAQSGNANLEKEAVIEYCNIAIAGIQAYNTNTQQKQPAATTGGSTQTGTGAEEDPVEILRKSGLTLSRTQIDDIAAAMARAGKGKVINNTGNPVLNALAKVAGFQVANR